MHPFVTKCPPLLPGESEMHYNAQFDLLMDEIHPGEQTDDVLAEFGFTADEIGAMKQDAIVTQTANLTSDTTRDSSR